MENQIDPKIYDLYDEYCHTSMERREFFKRAASIPVVGGLTSLAMAQLLIPDYAKAQKISFTDERVKANYVTYPSENGNGDKIRGYLVQPKGNGPFPSVLIIHENRGLNPYIEDVTRRVASEGFLAFAPDALTPVGGYPGNDEDGKNLQANLNKEKIIIDLFNGAEFLRNHPMSNKKLGVTGFCFGGAVSNQLAIKLGANLKVAVPYYGSAPDLTEVSKIKSAMVLHFAEKDDRVNEGMEGYKKELEKTKIDFAVYVYPGTQHGFHNDSTPRYDEKSANLSWERTIAAFKKYLV